MRSMVAMTEKLAKKLHMWYFNLLSTVSTQQSGTFEKASGYKTKPNMKPNKKIIFIHSLLVKVQLLIYNK